MPSNSRLLSDALGSPLRAALRAAKPERLAVMLRAACAVLLAAASLHASAKCIEEQYRVGGHIKDPAGHPIVGALVAVSWTDHVGGGDAQGTSGPDGAYSVEFRSSTLSSDSVLRGDICEATVASASVKVSAAGFLAADSVVKFSRGKAQASYTLRKERLTGRGDR